MCDLRKQKKHGLGSGQRRDVLIRGYVSVQLFFSLMFTYPSFPQPLSWPFGAVDLQAWKEVMITLEKDNDSFAVDTYKMLVPEPAGPQVLAASDHLHQRKTTIATCNA